MSLHRRAAKRDANEAGIVAVLEAGGCIVERLSGTGVPDLVVFRQGSTTFVEVKNPAGRNRQTAAQRRWRGPRPVTIRSQDEAVEFLRTGGVREA